MSDTASGCGILGVGVVYWVWYTGCGCGILGVVYWVWVWYTGCGCHSRYCAPMQTLKELEVLLKTHEEEHKERSME